MFRTASHIKESLRRVYRTYWLALDLPEKTMNLKDLYLEFTENEVHLTKNWDHDYYRIHIKPSDQFIKGLERPKDRIIITPSKHVTQAQMTISNKESDTEIQRKLDYFFELQFHIQKESNRLISEMAQTLKEKEKEWIHEVEVNVAVTEWQEFNTLSIHLTSPHGSLSISNESNGGLLFKWPANEDWIEFCFDKAALWMMSSREALQEIIVREIIQAEGLNTKQQRLIEYGKDYVIFPLGNNNRKKFNY